MKKNQICVIALLAVLTLSFMSITSIQPASAATFSGYTMDIDGKDWYFWSASVYFPRYSAIVLYDGTIYSDYVEIDSIDSQNTTARWDLIVALHDEGYDILTPAETCSYSSSNNEWLTNASSYLKDTRGAGLVTLFGWGAGGTAVGYEIQKTHAEAYYSCAVIADALVNFPFPGLNAIYYTGANAGNTKVSTAFICNENDYEYQIWGYPLAYPGMSSYYNGMPAGLEKEWHDWSAGTNAHDPFPDTCGDHGGETVFDVSYNFEITVEAWDSIESLGGKNWYYWNCSSDSVAILLFGGQPSSDHVQSKAFGSASTLKFIHELHAQGIDVVALNAFQNYYITDTWVSDAAEDLRNNYDYEHICVFGHSAGGIIVGNEILQPGADSLYDAAVLACAPVDCYKWLGFWPTHPLYHTALNASSAKVRTSFIKADDDFQNDTQLYHDNFNSSLDKELHHWSNDAFDYDAHDIFPDEDCYWHDGETLADVVYYWLTRPTYQLTVEAWNQYGAPGYGISVYIDGDYAGTTFNSFEVTHGNHTVMVPNDLGGSVFHHYQWQSCDYYDNPIELRVTSNYILYAWYYTYY